MEFYEEALSLTCDLTTTKISDNMWEVLADIYNVFERDGLDYFTDMMPALHNYVTVSLIISQNQFSKLFRAIFMFLYIWHFYYYRFLPISFCPVEIIQWLYLT